MTRNARAAYTILKNRNVHVWIDDSGTDYYGAHFFIGAEARTNDDIPVADYYGEFFREYEDEYGKIHNPFNVRTWVDELLTDKDLFAEWINPGLLGVYDR